jgi:hypothetical protein
VQSSMQLFSRVLGLRLSFWWYPTAQKLVSCSPLNRLLPILLFTWFYLVELFQLFLHKGKSNGSVHHLQHIKAFFFFIMLPLFILNFFL